MIRTSSTSSSLSRAKKRLPMTRSQIHKTSTCSCIDTIITTPIVEAICIDPPLSPSAKRLKRIEDNAARNAAFRDLEVLKMGNAGFLGYTEIEGVLKKYKGRNKNVDRCHLDYRCRLSKQGLPLPGEERKKKPPPIVSVDNDATTVSPLTSTSPASAVDTGTTSRTGWRFIDTSLILVAIEMLTMR